MLTGCFCSLKTSDSGPKFGTESPPQYASPRYPGLCQISYRPCYLQDTVMRPGAKPLLLHRPLQQPLRVRRQFTISPYLLRIHLGIGEYLPRRAPCRAFGSLAHLRKSLMLRLPGGQHPIPYLRRPLCRRAPPRNSLYCTAGTSMWMSILSNSGPETFDT
jgi:hypothetical protein